MEGRSLAALAVIVDGRDRGGARAVPAQRRQAQRLAPAQHGFSASPTSGGPAAAHRARSRPTRPALKCVEARDQREHQAARRRRCRPPEQRPVRREDGHGDSATPTLCTRFCESRGKVRPYVTAAGQEPPAPCTTTMNWSALRSAEDANT